MFKAFACVPGGQAVEIAKEEVAARLADGTSHVWIDISSPVDEHMPFLEETMQFHTLAVEDILHPRMLPKVDQFDNYLFIVLHDIAWLHKEDEEDRLRTHELYMFLGSNFVVTIHKHRNRAVDYFLEEPKVISHYFARGVESMAHAIIRRMIDTFFPLLDRVDVKLDAAENKIFDSPSQVDLQQIFGLRKDIMRLRSIATQELDVINRLALGEFETLSPHGLLLARDLYDHLYRLSEKAGGFRDLIMGLLDAYLSQVSNRMNEVMKVLTIIATIMLPLSIVVGYYGMNFTTIPGLHHPYGWLYTLIGMGVMISGMLGYFRYRKWI